VIRAGPASEVAASRLNPQGLRTALIERELVGWRAAGSQRRSSQGCDGGDSPNAVVEPEREDQDLVGPEAQRAIEADRVAVVAADHQVELRYAALS
jgi:hypothetical protein